MYFRQMLHVLLLFVVLANLGCGEFLKGKKRTEESLTIENIETQCLKTLPSTLSSYLDDQASGAAVDGAFACLQGSLKTFLKYTRGENPNQYSDKEIQHFFNRYLLSGNQVSDALLQEIMKFKVFAVGGSRRSFTRIEIDQFSAYIELLHQQATALNGRIRVLLFRQDKNNSQVSQAELKLTKDLVKKMFEVLILESKIGSSDLEFSDLGSLINEVNSFLGTTDRMGQFIKWFPFMSAFKVLFIGEHAKIQSRTEWQEKIAWSSESFFLGLQFYYETRNLSFDFAQDWQKLIHFSDRLFELIEQSPVILARGFLPAQNIDILLERIWQLQLFNSKLAIEVVKNTYKKVIYHLIDAKGANRGDAFEVRGIDQREFALLKFEYQIWRQTQLMTAEIFKSELSLSVAQVQAAAKSFDRSQLTRVLGPRTDYLDAAWSEWLLLLNSERPMVLSADLKLRISNNMKQEMMTLGGLSTSAALRTLTRLTMRGYGNSADRDLFRSAMTEARLIDLEFDFREFGQAVGFLDKRQNNAPQRTFKEGNFFTFAGNGDLYLDGVETYQLLNFMVSGGGAMATDVENLIESYRGHLPELDGSQFRQKSSEDIFRQVLNEKFAQIFNSLPSLVAAKHRMAASDWDEIYLNVMSLSRVEGFKSGVTEYAEIRAFLSILQYVESLMVQIDTDSSGTLSKNELLKAEPRFHQLLMSLSPIKKESVIPELFLYLIYEGKLPKTEWQLLSYAGRRAFTNMGEVSRLSLVRVLSLLKNSGRK